MAGNALKGVTGVEIAAYALGFQGVRYLWGGESPSTGFDCSGFAQYVYKTRAGVELPRVSQQQAQVGVDVLGGPYLPGDLLFFHASSHEGISLGGQRFVHAPHTGDVVKISSLGAGYQPNAARRILSREQAAMTQPSGQAPATADAASWGGWASAFLQRAGFPQSSNNLRFVLGWMKAENPSKDYTWNPLATTLRTSAATRPQGVQAYKDELSGIDATVQTIQGGQYAELRRQLAGSAPAQSTWDALRRSPWDAGHYASAPSPPYQPGDDRRAVVGAKKGGGGGLLGTIEGAAGGVLGQAADPFGLWGIGKSPGDAAGAIGGAASDAAGAALGPVGDAISGAASAVVSEAESLFVRAAWIGLGLVLGGAALVLILRQVGGGMPGVPLPPGSSGAAGAASGAAGAAAELPEAALAAAA